MKICKHHLIPCPAVLTEWSELPCMWSQENCDIWCEKVLTLKGQLKDGTEIDLDFRDIAEKAQRLFNSGHEKVELSDIITDG